MSNLLKFFSDLDNPNDGKQKNTHNKNSKSFKFSEVNELTLFNSDKFMVTLYLSERCLLYMLLSGVLRFDRIVEIQELLKKYSFSQKVLNDHNGKLIHETWINMCHKAKEKINTLPQFQEDESISNSFLPLHCSQFMVKFVVNEWEYIAFLNDLKKFDYWETYDILKSELERLQKTNMRLYDLYYKVNTDNHKINGEDMEKFEQEFNSLPCMMKSDK